MSWQALDKAREAELLASLADELDALTEKLIHEHEGFSLSTQERLWSAAADLHRISRRIRNAGERS